MRVIREPTQVAECRANVKKRGNKCVYFELPANAVFFLFNCRNFSWIFSKIIKEIATEIALRTVTIGNQITNSKESMIVSYKSVIKNGVGVGIEPIIIRS